MFGFGKKKEEIEDNPDVIISDTEVKAEYYPDAWHSPTYFADAIVTAYCQNCGWKNEVKAGCSCHGMQELDANIPIIVETAESHGRNFRKHRC